MRFQSAIGSAVMVITHTVTVAAGVFAPGHLGELTRIIPFELVDDVLLQAKAGERRLRDLPSRVGMYFLLALSLFPEVGYRGVWRKLTGGLNGLAVPSPSEKALRDLRRRIGAAPVKALFEVLAGPLALPAMPGVRFGRYRTVSFDGCSSIKVPDLERNRSWLGKVRHRMGPAGYPMLELMTLVETGTRGLLGAVFGPTAEGETSYAARLLHLLKPDMLVLADRGFDGNEFMKDLAATGAQFLIRVKSARRLPIIARLCDGSYLSRIGGLRVRVIEARVRVTCANGATYTGVYQLATTLTDHRRHSATALIRLYHERWEHESSYYALRHTLMKGRVLRSGDAPGIEQEMWALLACYQALRIAMVAAAESVPGTDPDRASFTIAFQVARDLLINATGVISTDADPIGDIGRAVLAHLLPARRLRVSARKVKSPISRYHIQQDEGRPSTSMNITALEVAVRPLAPGAPDLHLDLYPDVEPGYLFDDLTTPPPPSRRDQIIAILRSDPSRAWHAREVAHAISVENLNSLRVQMSRLAHEGVIIKIEQAVYRIADKPIGRATPGNQP